MCFFFATPLKTQFPVSGLLLSSIQRFWCLSTRFFRSFLCQIVRRNIWESIMLLFDPIFPNCKPQFITDFILQGSWGERISCFVQCSVFSPCLSIAPSLIFLLNLARFLASKEAQIHLKWVLGVNGVLSYTRPFNPKDPFQRIFF